MDPTPLPGTSLAGGICQFPDPKNRNLKVRALRGQVAVVRPDSGARSRKGAVPISMFSLH